MLLTCVEQGGDNNISMTVKREVAQSLQECHGADNGVAFVVVSCCFYDFETCEEIKAGFSSSNVRFLPRDDVA